MDARPFALAVALMAALSLPARAQDAEIDLPLWELGAGGIARVSTAYPGADIYTTGVTPIPYIKYRGRVLELGGDETVRLTPFRTERFELGITIDGSSSVDNRETALGGALPDLDALVEFGPELIFRLAQTDALLGDNAPGRIEAILQTRGVFSLGETIEYAGAIVRPAVRYRQNAALKPGSRLQASLGPIFATEGVQDVFYQVEPGPAGPGYDATGGYLGTEMRASLRYPLTNRMQALSGVAVTYIGGAANADSPLVRTDWDATAFVGLTVSLYQSKARARRDR